MKLPFLFISLFLLITFSGESQNSVTLQKIVPEQFIKSWLLLGPIPLQMQKDPNKSWEHLPGFNTDYLQK